MNNICRIVLLLPPIPKLLKLFTSNWELLILKNIISNVSCTVNGLGFYEIFCLINHIDEKSV